MYNCPPLPDEWKLVYVENPSAEVDFIRSAVFEHARQIVGQSDKDFPAASISVACLPDQESNVTEIFVRNPVEGNNLDPNESLAAILQKNGLPAFPIQAISRWVRAGFRTTDKGDS